MACHPANAPAIADIMPTIMFIIIIIPIIFIIGGIMFCIIWFIICDTSMVPPSVVPVTVGACGTSIV
jgi:flagellar basal body-associated protein FliL